MTAMSRHHGADRPAAAIARRQEIGDGGGVLPLGDGDELGEDRRAQRDHQDRAGIDKEEVEPLGGRPPHRSVECPGGAIDRQGQAIDQPFDPAAAPAGGIGVADLGDDEQQAQIADGQQDDGPALKHGMLAGSPFCPTAARACTSSGPSPALACVKRHARRDRKPEFARRGI